MLIRLLSLTSCYISNADEPSIRAILKCNTLKSLCLIPSDLGPEAAVNLFSTLIDNTSLETLDISYSKCLDDGDTEALPGVIEAALSKYLEGTKAKWLHSLMPSCM